MQRWAGVLVALAALALAAAPAGAQTTEQDPEQDGGAVLLLLDASKSMAKPAGGGRTRIEAAREAVRQVVGALPRDAQVGLRVYGSRLSNTTRRAGCRDTRLTVPVGPLDKEALVAGVEALEPTGFTPIGRSLRATPQDLASASGRRTVVLVSDGGDNCAPPDPCRVARDVAEQGIDLSIQVIGLQVDERARRQLRCIARAGGGAYVDAGDPEELIDELRAVFARARRSYAPSGTPVQGGPTARSAAPVGAGQYLDEIRPGESRHYAITLEEGQALWAAATTILPSGFSGGGGFKLRLLGADGEPAASAAEGLTDYDLVRGAFVRSQVVKGEPVGRGSTAFPRPGPVVVEVAYEGSGDPIPVELLLQPREPGRLPDRDPGPGPKLTRLEPPASARREPAPDPSAGEGAKGGATSSAAVLGAGGAGLAGGLVVGLLAFARRRRGTGA